MDRIDMMHPPTTPLATEPGAAPRARILRSLIVGASLALVVTACGSADEAQSVDSPGIESPPVESVAPETAEVEPAESQTDEPQTDDTAPTQGDEITAGDDQVDARPVIASAPGSARFPELWIHSFRREGDVLRLDFTVSVQGPGSGESYYLRKTFSSIEDSEITGDASNSLRAASFSGITLVDSVNNNRHLVLRDTSGDCLCTSFPDYFISDDYPESFDTPGAALFPAPPADVTSMTVMFPVFGSFELEIENV